VVADARVIMNREAPALSRGFGFVTFESAAAAAAALRSAPRLEGRVPLGFIPAITPTQNLR
jgi:hypothetical protein